MHRKHELLQNEELYVHCGEAIEKNVAAMQRQVFSLRDYLGSRKRGIVKELGTKDDQKQRSALETATRFYDHVLEELAQMEEMCEEYLVGMKLDLSAEARDRLQPPSHVPLAQIKKAFEQAFGHCGDVFESDGASVPKRCTWTNVPRRNLRDTIDILNKPRVEVPTEFDGTDLKFKQEMTVLRTKMFSMTKKKFKSKLNEDIIKTSYNTHTTHTEETGKKNVKTLRKYDSLHLSEVHNLKFVDGEFAACEIWSKTLDVHGKQLRSKWLFVFCPQIRKIMSKRRIHILHLNPLATFNFLASIYQNGFKFLLTKEHLLPLLEDFAAEAVWLTSWTLQFKTFEGTDIAATMIQALWRGYRLRQRIRESERRYIAASVLWFAWICLLKTRRMQQRYFNKILTSLNITRQLSLTFSNDFNRFITESHVVLHLSSLGYPMEIRRKVDPKALSIKQNTMCLKISFTRNPNSEVIYVLPVQASEDLLSMYRDIVNSVDPAEAVTKRITFVTLSEAKTFERRSLNASRILHCSEVTLQNIRKKITGKPAYILPWIVDDCDVRLADNLGLPMLGPDLQLQRELLNLSRISEIIEGLELLQPVHARNLKDYGTICRTLAELIVTNTEICMWLIRLNCRIPSKHSGMFVINHMSVPFMPLLRKERAKFGDEWKINPDLRVGFLDALLHQLPEVVFKVTRLSNYYASWKEFYAHVQKFGCFLQAVPDEKSSTTVAVSLFVPGLASGEKPKWIGTADKIHVDTSFTTFAYMLPQTSIDTSHFERIVNKFTLAMQQRGYFGYLTIDCFCYPYKHKENIIALILDVHPYYCHVQQYIDWVKFAIGGRYSKATNTFNANVAALPIRGKSSYALKPPKWNETTERYAIAISQLYDDRFASYHWPQLKTIIEANDILYDATTKEGSHLILHDSEIRNSAMFIAISSSMDTAITMTHNNLSRLHDALCTKSKKRFNTNIQETARFFADLHLKYGRFSANQCL